MMIQMPVGCVDLGGVMMGGADIYIRSFRGMWHLDAYAELCSYLCNCFPTVTIPSILFLLFFLLFCKSMKSTESCERRLLHTFSRTRCGRKAVSVILRFRRESNIPIQQMSALPCYATATCAERARKSDARAHLWLHQTVKWWLSCGGYVAMTGMLCEDRFVLDPRH